MTKNENPVYSNIMENWVQKTKYFSNLFKKQHSNRIKTVNHFLEMLKERREVIENFNSISENSFNIFKDLSIDSKFSEINHSKMLGKILSPDTREIGDKQYLKIFIDLLEKIKGQRLQHLFDGKIEVKCEEGRQGNINERGAIDIFISSQKYSIIIENKITQKANDKDNQLARYYNISKKKGKKPLAIVYIPYNYTKPPINKYTGEYKKLKKTVTDLLIIVPALDLKKKNDLTHGFLDECSNFARREKKHTAYVCLDQYSKLIKSKGDQDRMAMLGNKKFIAEVLSNEELRKTVEEIVDIWKNHRAEALGELLLDHLIEKFNFKIISTGYYGKKINEDVFIYYGYNDFQLGFCSSVDGKLSKHKAELKRILTTNKDNIVFEDADNTWVWGHINQDVLFSLSNFNDMKDFLSFLVKDFEKEAKKLLKPKKS